VQRRVAVPSAELLALGVGALATFSAVEFIGRYGTGFGLGLTIGGCLLVAIIGAFAFAPHMAVAVAIPYFVLLPTLKVFISGLLGGTKDLISLSAVVAALILYVRRRAARRGSRVDRVVVILLAFLLGLYLLNIGGNLTGESGYGAAWFHGVRLFAEPLALFLVGASLREPARTFRWARTSLAVTAVAVALVGIVQQFLGVERLVLLGYTYGKEVRQLGPHLRSFGTLEEPFMYAGMLLLGAAVISLRGRTGPIAAAALAVVGLGLLFSYVRTAAVISVALVGLIIARRGHLRTAILLTACAFVAGVVFFAVESDVPSQRTVRVNSNQYLTLNGRTTVWSAALGDKRSAWVFGRGVGAVGTASQRANESLTGSSSPTNNAKKGTIVDSGYIVALADVGVVGLTFLLALFGRLVFLAGSAARRGESSGWIALGLLTVMSLDALTRESLTGFPTAYVAMLVVGIASATWVEPEPERKPAAEPAAVLVRAPA
jgi:O-antigen ligase